MNETGKAPIGEASAKDSNYLIRCEKSLWRLHRWLRKNGWAGYDPYDLQGWYLDLPAFVRRVRPLRYAASAILRLGDWFPYALRRLLVHKQTHPKAMGLFADAYATLYELHDDPDHLRTAETCAEWLLAHRSQGCRGYGWGLPFHWQSRVFISAGTPCVTVTAVCGDAFWRLFQLTGREQYLDVCRHICTYILHDLNMERFDKDTVCFSYTPIDHYHVHNANLMAASFLVMVGRQTGAETHVDLGLQAANYALKEQREDGSLSYWGDDQATGFQSDHYHSGFEIRMLHSLWKHTGCQDFRQAFQRYYAYYERTFFAEDGAPLRNPGDSQTVDIHGCAEALICNAQVLPDLPQAREVLLRAAAWILDHMQTPHGYFIYRLMRAKGGGRRIDVPFIRWGQAWMMKGLTSVLAALQKNDGQGDRRTPSP